MDKNIGLIKKNYTSKWKIGLSPFLKDVFFTSVISLLSLVLSVILIRILTQELGTEEFGAYSIARRFFATVYPFSTLTMGVALARFIAISKDKTSKNKYLLSGLILGVLPSFIILAIGVIFADDFAILIFQNKSYSSLFIAVLFMLVGYSFFNVLYSYYRGSGEMGKANLWQLALASIGPLAIALIYAKYGKVDLLIFLMGLIFFISFIPLAFFSFKVISQDEQALKIRIQLKELLKYGLPRVPAGLALSGLLSVGIFLAPYYGTLKDAGYLVIGLSMLSIVESAVFAFGIVALPRVAQLFSESKNEYLKDRITDIIAIVFHLGLFATLHIFLWSDLTVLVWLGNQYTDSIPLMRIILLALVPYLAYVMLRSVIDAIEERAINTYNLFISFGITLVISLVLATIGQGTMGLAVGTTLGFLALGFLTILHLWKIYGIKFNELKIKESLLLNVTLIGVAIILRPWTIAMPKEIIQVIIVFLIEAMLLFLYFVILWKLNIRWIFELRNRIFLERHFQ